jgi:hypothetical protein
VYDFFGRPGEEYYSFKTKIQTLGIHLVYASSLKRLPLREKNPEKKGLSFLEKLITRNYIYQVG